MEELTVSQIKSKRIVYLVVSTITLLFLGLIYAFSMFKGPMCTSFNIDSDAMGLTFDIMMIVFCIGAVIGSQIEKIMGVKPTIIIAAVMFAVGFIGTGFLGNDNVIAVYIFYGAIAGAGVGIGYNTIIATTNVWFPDMVGISSGVLMMGFGLGALILGNIALAMYGGGEGMDLSSVYLIIGLAGGLIALLAGLLLRRPPANIVELMAPEKAAASGYDPAEDDSALKTPLFYVYWIWATIVIAVGLATLGFGASDGVLAGFDSATAVLLVSIVSAFNGIGRVIVGTIFDKTNVKVTMLIDGIVAIIATASITVALINEIPALYAIGALCCGFCYGGVPVVASAFSRQRFGSKNYPLNLSLANFAIVWGSILNLIIQGVTGGARLSVFVVLIILAILATLDVLPFSKMFNKSQAELDKRRVSHTAH